VALPIDWEVTLKSILGVRYELPSSRYSPIGYSDLLRYRESCRRASARAVLHGFYRVEKSVFNRANRRRVGKRQAKSSSLLTLRRF
jgi:hypothetical protein